MPYSWLNLLKNVVINRSNESLHTFEPALTHLLNAQFIHIKVAFNLHTLDINQLRLLPAADLHHLGAPARELAAHPEVFFLLGFRDGDPAPPFLAGIRLGDGLPQKLGVGMAGCINTSCTGPSSMVWPRNMMAILPPR